MGRPGNELNRTQIPQTKTNTEKEQNGIEEKRTKIINFLEWTRTELNRIEQNKYQVKDSPAQVY